MFFGFQAGDDSRIKGLLHYSGFRRWSETVAPAGAGGPLIQFCVCQVDFLFGAPQVEVKPAVEQGGAVAQVDDAGFLVGSGDEVAHVRVWPGSAHGAVGVQFRVAEGYRKVVAVIEELVRAQGEGFGIALEAAGLVAAVVAVASGVARMVVGDIGYSIAQEVIGGGVAVFQKPLLVCVEQAGGPVCAQQPGFACREGPGFVFAHHLGVQAHGLVAQGEAVADVYAAELVAGVLPFALLAVFFADERVPQGGAVFRLAFSTKLNDAGQADIQALHRPEGEAHADEFGVVYGALVLILAGEHGEVPGADPAEPSGGWCQVPLAVEPYGGHGPGVVGQNQAGLPARAPPALDGASAQHPVTKGAGQVAAVVAVLFVVGGVGHYGG